MRIAVDLASAYGNVDGIGTYARGLVQGLLTTQLDLNIVPIYGCLPSARNMWCPESSIVRRRPTLMPRRIYSYLIGRGFPVELSTGAVDIVHWPDYCSYRAYRAKIVVTIHDLAFIERPDFYSEESRRHYDGLMKATLDHADHLITDSECTSSSIRSAYGWPAEKLTCAHLGGAEIADLDTSDTELPVPSRNYIIAVGSHVPRKNYTVMVKAFAELRSMMPESDVKLVVVGKHGSVTPMLMSEADSLGIGEHVFWIGYVSDCEKAALIKGARCLVHTSLHEGFGIPLVEAMACGVPLVYSNTTACPEIAGDAGISCDPTEPSAFANAIAALMRDSGYAESLRQGGLLRARSFTWEQCARRVREIYNRVLLGG